MKQKKEMEQMNNKPLNGDAMVNELLGQILDLSKQKATLAAMFADLEKENKELLEELEKAKTNK